MKKLLIAFLFVSPVFLFAQVTPKFKINGGVVLASDFKKTTIIGFSGPKLMVSMKKVEVGFIGVPATFFIDGKLDRFGLGIGFGVVFNERFSIYALTIKGKKLEVLPSIGYNF